jgi:hypothetical protein
MRVLKPLIYVALPAALGAAAGSGTAYAGPLNLVQNGDFESTTMSSPTQMNQSNVSDWSTSGYNFIYFAGTGQTGSYTPEYNSLVQLWGPSLGANNGFTATSPTGGNFIGADGAYQVGAITQTLTGLVAGAEYAVSFYYAGAQQYGYTGQTSEAWSVSLGSQSFETPVLQNASHGFTGWMPETFIFTATGTSEVLSFLAIGTPNGEPPFSLLDGVTAFEVSEPGTWGMLGAGAGLLGFIGWKRARRGARGSAAAV